MIVEVHAPCNVQGRPLLERAAQFHISHGLVCLLGWGIHNHLWQAVSLHPQPLCAKLVPTTYLSRLLSRLKTVPPTLS